MAAVSFLANLIYLHTNSPKDISLAFHCPSQPQHSRHHPSLQTFLIPLIPLLPLTSSAQPTLSPSPSLFPSASPSSSPLAFASGSPGKGGRFPFGGGRRRQQGERDLGAPGARGQRSARARGLGMRRRRGGMLWSVGGGIRGVGV